MERRYDLDWLRILLFGLLVPHHAAVGFVAWGKDIYGFVNDEVGGDLLSLGIYFSHSWRLPSLFLIAGIGTYFATGRGIGAKFLGRRVARLIVPALFGTFALNVAAGYAIARMSGDPSGFLAFWRSWLTEPEPHQVMHLWFLFNLTFYTLLCWPLYAFRRQLEASTFRVSLLLLGLVAGVTLIAVLFKPFGAAIAGDGYQLPWYWGIFAAGYVIGTRHEAVLDWVKRRAFLLLLAGIAFFSVEVAILGSALERSPESGTALAEGGWAKNGLAPAFGRVQTLFTAVEGVNAWLWCLAALGLAARYLNRSGPVLQFLGRATFSVYVLHFPVTIVGLALLARIQWPWEAEFLLLTAAVYVITGSLYLVAVKTGPLVYLIGGRPRAGTDSRHRRLPGDAV